MPKSTILTDNGAVDDAYRNFIALSRYARWREEDGRRESWQETVDRWVNFFDSQVDIKPEDLKDVREAILNHEVMPSMRGLMTAGPALERNHIALYNCSLSVIDSLRSFDEVLYILSHGTGVGFSVEKQYVDKLPEVAETFVESDTTITVGDSKEGWQKAFRELLALLWAGQLPNWDISKIRPRGARLKTFGGTASGPGPLVELFEFATKLVYGAAGRKITPLEAHDLVCKIGDVIVSGGVRRSALISLSDLGDTEMAHAKSGAWWENNGQRALANNSAVYQRKPSMDVFMTEWKALYDSKSGERGIVNRQAMRKQADRNGRRDSSKIIGTNPCGEVALRPYQFCNLSEIIVRPEDTLDDLRRKARLATLIGTWQSTLTNFKGIRKIWKNNTEEERLLGVSMTGVFGNKLTNGVETGLAERLQELREVTVETNRAESERLGIPQSTAISLNKPSGTVSQLTGTSSGIHAWHNDYYIRTVRGSNDDPITKFLKDVGIPAEPDVMNPDKTTVFSFPVKAPKGAITRKDLTAVEHLELWLTYKQHWCEHNPSVTISVREDEWLEVGAWVYEHFDELSGVSFLPYSEHTYQQAPYQDVDEETYKEALEAMPKEIRWEDLSFYEFDDGTTGSQELACSSGACEIVDIS